MYRLDLIIFQLNKRCMKEDGDKMNLLNYLELRVIYVKDFERAHWQLLRMFVSPS